MPELTPEQEELARRVLAEAGIELKANAAVASPPRKDYDALAQEVFREQGLTPKPTGPSQSRQAFEARHGLTPKATNTPTATPQPQAEPQPVDQPTAIQPQANKPFRPQPAGPQSAMEAAITTGAEAVLPNVAGYAAFRAMGPLPLKVKIPVSAAAAAGTAFIQEGLEFFFYKKVLKDEGAYRQKQAYQKAAREDFPKATLAAQFAAGIPVAKPELNLKLISAVGRMGMKTKAGQAAAEYVKQSAIRGGVSAAIGTAFEGFSQFREEKFDPQRLFLAALLSSFMNGEWRYMKGGKNFPPALAAAMKRSGNTPETLAPYQEVIAGKTPQQSPDAPAAVQDATPQPQESVAPDVQPTATEPPVSVAPTKPPLYRETNIKEAAELFPTSNSSEAMPFGYEETHVATHPDLALGQGSNKGVIVEMDSSNLNFQERRPVGQPESMTDMGAQGVVKVKGTESLRPHVRSITVKPGAIGDKVSNSRFALFAKQALAAGWTKEKLPDGSTKYTRPESQPSTEPAAVQAEAPTATQDQVAAPTEAAQPLPEAPPPLPPTAPPVTAAAPESGIPATTRNLSLLSKEQEIRKVMTTVDTAMESNGYPEPQRVAQWQSEGSALHDADPRAAYNELVAGNNDYVDPAQVMKSIKALSTSGLEDLRSGTEEGLMRVTTAAVNERLQGTALGRAMRARGDPSQTPAERKRQQIRDLLTAPSEQDLKIMETAKDDKKLKLIRAQANRTLKAINRLKDMGIDATNVSDEILSDPKKVAALLRELQAARSTLADREFEYFRNSILSGLPTQSVNLFGGISNASYDYILLRPIQAILNAMTGNNIKTATTAADLVSIYRAMITSKTWQSATRNAIESFQTELPITGAGMSVEQHKSGAAIPGKLGRVIRIPQRGLLTVDEFSKTAIMQMEVMGHALREARGKGLVGAEKEAFIKAEIDNPASKSWAESLDTAKRIMLQEQVGELSQMAIKAREIPGPIGWVARHLFPFIVTMTNATKIGIRRTPLGLPKLLLKTLPAWKRGAVSSDKATREIAEQLIAVPMTIWLHGKVNEKDENGLPAFITGSKSYRSRGKSDAEYRVAPPQSIKIDGEWRDYSRIEPLATSLTLMVDMLQTNDEGTMDKVYRSMSGLVRDKTMLRSISDLMQLAESAVRGKSATGALADYTANFASSYMPNLIKSAGRAMDPYVRNYMVEDPNNHWTDWFKRLKEKSLPFPELMPPPKVDIWGRDITKSPNSTTTLSDFSYRLFSPLAQRNVISIENFDRMLFNWNNKNPDSFYWPTVPSATLTNKKRMTEDQYHDFLKARGEIMLKIGKDKRYKFNFDNPTERDIKVLKRLFSSATSLAARTVGVERKEVKTEESE